MSAKDSPSCAKVGESQDGGALGSLKRFQILKKICPNLDSTDSSDSSTSTKESVSRNSSIDYDPAAATASFICNSTRDFLAFLDIINKAMA